MIAYKKKTEKSFSVLKNTKKLRKVSPALISLISKGKRRINFDRVDEIAKLLNLKMSEKRHLKDLVFKKELIHNAPEENPNTQSCRRKEVTHHLYNDWLNVYVQDCFSVPAVQKNPKKIYQMLGSVAMQKRIQRSYEFLIKHGYLRHTIDGKVVPSSNLSLYNQDVPKVKIRQFHKAALNLSKIAINEFSIEERLANTLTIALDEKGYGEVLEIIADFSTELQKYTERYDRSGERLYQLVINFCPIGGKAIEG